MSDRAILGHPRRWAILGVLIAAEFLVELDTTIVNVALPNMARSLGAGTNALQWIVDAYTLAFAGLLLLAGALADRLGRRPVLLGGLALFALGSLLASLATSAGWLIGARGLMGVGAAAILPTTLSVMTRVFPTAERERAFGLWSATAGLSFALGPTLGGALVKGFGWAAVFLVNLPIVAAAAAGTLALVPRGRDERATPPDVVGAALSVAGLGTLLYAIIEAPKHGWQAAGTLTELGVAVALLAALVAWERQTPHPMLDLHLFRLRSFWAPWVAIGLTFLAIFGVLFILTQYLQVVLGHSALGAGVRVLPVPLAVVAATPLSLVVERLAGTKGAVTLGLCLTTASLAITSAMSTSTGYGLVAIGFVLAGAGMGLALTPATNSMLAAIARVRAGSGAALNNTAMVVGSALGVAILGSVLSTGYHSRLAPVLHGLPAAAAAHAQSSIAAATALARGTPALLAGARGAFVDASAHTFVVAAAIAAAGALIALLFVPRRAAEDQISSATASSRDSTIGAVADGSRTIARSSPAPASRASESDSAGAL